MIRSFAFLLALLTCALQSPAAAQEAGSELMMLRLRDGSFRMGTIQRHTADGLTFRMLENGGEAKLSWGRLDPRQELELKSRLGYIDTTGDEVLVDADRIVTIEGQEVIGRILERTKDGLLVKTASSTTLLPQNRIAGAATVVQVSALEIYTREELYARQLAQTDAKSAAALMELARYCERILDFKHAVDHYTAIQTVDPTFKSDDVRASLSRAQEKAKNQNQLEYLAEIDTLLARRKYDEAGARAIAFGERFPGSPLVAEAQKRGERIAKARDGFLVDFVRHKWFERSQRIARTASTTMTLEQVLSFLEEKMREEVLNAVTKDAQAISKSIDADAVRKLFAQRKRVRWERASFGFGTWLLGEDRALKGEQQAPAANQQPTTELDKQRQALNAQIQRYLQNQQMVARAKTTAEEGEDRAKFWTEYSSASRTQWILAYYAEYGGDFEVNPKPELDNCSECGGTGVRVLSLVGGNVAQPQNGQQRSTATDEKRKCETCHGLGRVRRILYR